MSEKKVRIGDIAPTNSGAPMTIYTRPGGGSWIRLTKTEQKQVHRTEAGDGWYGFGPIFDLDLDEKVEIIERMSR